MPGFSRRQNSAQHPLSAVPARPDHAKFRHAPAGISYLARPSTLGNQALQRLLRTRPIQARLKVNESGDEYERQADHVADQVMRMPDAGSPKITADATAGRKKGAACEGGDLCSWCTGEAEKFKIQSEGKSGPPAPSIFSAAPQIDALRGGGQPLPSSSRTFFEVRFGQDFGKVRLHTDSAAAAAAKTINAKAFTLGSDVVFGAGYYAPEALAGQRLMAHELTHVVQQQALSAKGQRLQRQGVDVDEDIEEDLNKDVDNSGPDIVTSGGDMQNAPAQPPASLSPGLPQPDCNTRVDDVFQIGAITHATGPECSRANIRDLRNPQLGYQFYRADASLAGTPPCPDSAIQRLGHWLGNEWNIAEISTSGIKAINLCGDEGILGFNQGCKCPPPKQTPPERTINVTASFGKGSVQIFDRCHTVRFQSDDCCNAKEYKLDDSVGLWVLQGTEQITAYPPKDLSGLLTVNVHESGNCGNRFMKEPIEALEADEGE